MMTPTPLKLREVIVRLKEEGRTYEDIARLAGVGEATVSRTLRLHRETGRLTPKRPGGGNLSPIHGPVEQALRQLVARMPDATVEELAEALQRAEAIHTSPSAVQRALSRLGFSRKKSPSWRASATRRKTSSAGASSAP
jgi:transposase